MTNKVKAKYDMESLGEAFHVALRKFCFSAASNEAHRYISKMPDAEWGKFAQDFNLLMTGRGSDAKSIREYAILAAPARFRAVLQRLNDEDWKGISYSLKYAEESHAD